MIRQRIVDLRWKFIRIIIWEVDKLPPNIKIYDAPVLNVKLLVKISALAVFTLKFGIK